MGQNSVAFSIAHSSSSLSTCNELRGLSLDNHSITDYLLHVQNLVNELISIGESMPASKHLNLILDGLPDEYDSSILVISTKFDRLSIDEVKTILLEHEVRI